MGRTTTCIRPASAATDAYAGLSEVRRFVIGLTTAIVTIFVTPAVAQEILSRMGPKRRLGLPLCPSLRVRVV